MDINSLYQRGRIHHARRIRFLQFPRRDGSRDHDVEDTDLESVITDLREGQYINPVRVVGFNVSQGWVRDVSEDVVRELRQRCADQDRRLPDFLEEFVASYPTAKNMGLR